MSSLSKFKPSSFGICFCLALGLWVYSFWFFLCRQSPLFSDAISFYEHVRFYLENLSRGDIPLWDPYNTLGSPHEFFLRRIGAYNPFLLMMTLPIRCGLDPWIVFMSFVVFTYFLGMIGFYRIARELFQTPWVALTAFLLLTFSSLGTRVFDSYIMMVMTPMIWFFYFLLMFGRYQKPWALFGATGCVMLLMTTYIPFYFILIFLFFCLSYLCVYPQQTKRFFIQTFTFAKARPALVIFCIFSVLLSLVPGYLFFKHSGEGNLVMPLRHFNSAYSHVLGVKPEVTSYWAIPEDLLYSSFYLENLKLFNLAVFYIPLFAYIIFMLGIFLKLHRTVVLLFVWGASLFIVGSPYLFPTYDLLHKYIFFVKYFRNLHFFLWVAILPIFILFITQQLDEWVQLKKESQSQLALILGVVLAHLFMGTLMFFGGVVSWSSWLTLGVSFCFFVQWLYFPRSIMMTTALVFMVIALEPMEAYFHLQKNVIREKQFNLYEHIPKDFSYIRRTEEITKISGGSLAELSQNEAKPFYFGTIWFQKMWHSVAYKYLYPYIQHQFVIYDRVQPVDDDFKNGVLVRERWTGQEPFAWVPIHYAGKRGTTLPGRMQLIQGPSENFQVVQHNVNGVKVQTRFLTEQFVVYNSCYYPGWRAWVDGKEVPVFRSNVAFVGMWVPAGSHAVTFRFGDHKQYLVEIAFMVYYSIFFLWFMIIAWKDRYAKS